MKTIKGIDEKLEKFNPNDSEMDTFKSFYRAALGFSISKAGDEAIELFEIGIKIKRADKDVQLEDAEFKKLWEKTAANPVPWPNWVHGQLMARLKESEK